jgi:negative regulator of replication initiation
MIPLMIPLIITDKSTQASKYRKIRKIIKNDDFIDSDDCIDRFLLIKRLESTVNQRKQNIGKREKHNFYRDRLCLMIV